MANKLTHLNPQKTIFLLCDVQEKFRAAMQLFNNFLENTKRLTLAGKIFNIPLLVTEQYPEKLGHTVKDLDIGHAKAVISKTRFSMMVPEAECLLKQLYNGKPSDAVLYGLESHVCIEQTAIDLLEKRIKVYVVADCVTSRINQDTNLALERMRDGGCIIATCESIIYDLMRDKNHPKFNDLKNLLLMKSVDMKIWK